MAAALKRGVQEQIHQLAGKAGADNAAAHAQGVGIVVAAGVLAAEAVGFKTLKMLQGNIHQVYTGVTVLIKKNGKWEDISFSESTDVSFYPVSDEEIRTYIASGEPMDKAGSYGIQGGFGIYVKEIRGEYTNVVGLPVGRLFYEMKKHGIELRG